MTRTDEGEFREPVTFHHDYIKPKGEGEYVSLKRAYNHQLKHDGTDVSFNQWLDEQEGDYSSQESRPRPEKTGVVDFDPGLIDDNAYNNTRTYADARKLPYIWGDRNAKLIYQAGWNLDTDKIIFVSDELKPVNNDSDRLEIPVEDFNSALEALDIDYRIEYPEPDSSPIDVLQHLKLKGKTYRGTVLEVDESRRKGNMAETRKWLKSLPKLGEVAVTEDIDGKNEQLTKVWADPDAIAVYRYSQGKPDMIVFKSETLVGDKNKNGLVAVEVKDLNKILRKAKAEKLISHPTDPDDQSVLDILRTLKMGTETYQGKEMLIERDGKLVEKAKEEKPEGSKEKEAKVHTFKLKLNMDSLDRLTEGAVGSAASEAAQNRQAVLDLVDIMTNAPGSIDTIGFGTDADSYQLPEEANKVKITDIRIKTTDGKTIVVPAFMLTHVIDGIEPYHQFDDDKRDIVGFKLPSTGDKKVWEGKIYPKSSEKYIRQVLAGIEFDGNKLDMDAIKVTTPYGMPVKTGTAAT